MDSSNIIRCPVCGHSYDTRRDSSCPNCSKPALSPGTPGGTDNEMTVVQNVGSSRVPDLEATVSLNFSPPDDPNDVTVGISLSKTGSRRGEITGWLVCVGGPDYGRDFRLRYNNNFVGRDMDMDVCLASDNAVHKQKHMTVIFEPNERRFYCGPLGGAICYLNGEPLTRPVDLHDFDRIKLGNTELVFRSLCGEGYTW